MMDIVTSCNGESPLGFRADPPIRGAARWPYQRITASKHSGSAPSKTMATRGRRIPAQCAVIAALIGTASSVVGAAQLPVTAWLRSDWADPAVSEPLHPGLAALIRPAPAGEVTPSPPQIPAPTVKPIAPTVAAPPPQAEQPVPAPRQQQAPPPPKAVPPPAPEAPPPEEAPAPAPEAPPPAQEAPAPTPEAPPPPPETPPPPPPPRGHVQLAP